MVDKNRTGYKRNLGMIILLAFAGSIIYGLPYFRSYYYDAYREMYHLTNTEMGMLGSAYGLLAFFHMLFGFFQAKALPHMGIRGIIIFYSLAPLIVGILFIFILKEPGRQIESEEEGPKARVSWREMASVLKMPVMWLIIIMILFHVVR